MADRNNIYLLLEEIHEQVFPNATVGEVLKELDRLIGTFEKLSDGEFVTRLSGYQKSPFHVK